MMYAMCRPKATLFLERTMVGWMPVKSEVDQVEFIFCFVDYRNDFVSILYCERTIDEIFLKIDGKHYFSVSHIVNIISVIKIAIFLDVTDLTIDSFCSECTL